MIRSRVPAAAFGVCCCLFVRSSGALDKQGSAHGGRVGENTSGFSLSGSVSLGTALVNPSYAARPDNSGLALMRYAAHLDADLIGKYLSIPLDLNFFSDRQRSGLRRFTPSEFDVITGLTTTERLGRATAFELGARLEHDRPFDRGGLTQTYADSRARLLYSLDEVWPDLRRAFSDGGIAGAVTYGWFAYNPTYAARPDNSGRALFRYANHTELSLLHRSLAFGVDTTLFTDRKSDHPVSPSELDLTYEIIGRLEPLELHVAYERDMPLDKGNFVQTFLYALFVYPFDIK